MDGGVKNSFFWCQCQGGDDQNFRMIRVWKALVASWDWQGCGNQLQPEKLVVSANAWNQARV